MGRSPYCTPQSDCPFLEGESDQRTHGYHSTCPSFLCSELHCISKLSFNLIALRKATIVYNFCLSECSRVNFQNMNSKLRGQLHSHYVIYMVKMFFDVCSVPEGNCFTLEFTFTVLEISSESGLLFP